MSQSRLCVAAVESVCEAQCLCLPASGDRVRTVALADASKAEAQKKISQFTKTEMFQVLIISYDTFRLNSEELTAKKYATCAGRAHGLLRVTLLAFASLLNLN